MKALYGFSDKLAPFKDKSPTEQASELASWGVDAVFGGYENAAFVEALHQRGLKIYAEFGCFAGQRWWENSPESRPTLADGTLLKPIDWYYGVNPAVPKVRQTQLTAFTTLLQNHEIDGVWLDFIRWPCRWEMAAPRLLQTSFDAATIAQFRANTGLDFKAQAGAEAAHTILQNYAEAWVRWRCQQVTDWVAQARIQLEQIRPQAKLGMFAIPWRQADFDGAIRTIVGQDFAALAAYIDIFSPMTYHLMCGHAVDWISAVSQEIHQITGKSVCPIIQAVDHPTTLTTADYQAALEVAMNTPETAGVIVFTLKDMLTAEKRAATKAAFLAKSNNTFG